jgi:hypothetical protein
MQCGLAAKMPGATRDDAADRLPMVSGLRRQARMAGTVVDGAGHAWIALGRWGQEQEQGQQHT